MEHDRIILVGLAVCLLTVVTSYGKADDKTFKHDRYLVLDSRIIESTENAKLTIGKPVKSKDNPLMAEDKPWEKRYDNLYGNVIYDQQDNLYKCWYSPFIVDHSASGMTLQQRGETPYKLPRDREMAICYAVSKDGIKWDKPNLGIVEFEGSTQNNIVWRGLDGASVFKDLRERDPARRYKVLFKGRTNYHDSQYSKPYRLSAFAPGQKILCVAFSADGIHWGKAIPCPETSMQGDTHNNVFWAPTLGKYVGISRVGGSHGRAVGRTDSDDFVKWTKGKFVFQGADKRHQSYSMPVFFHGGVYIGLVAIIDSQEDRVWTELTWSPDTIKWNRICPGEPFIANSEKEMAYDWGCVFATAPVFLDNEIRIYYGAGDGNHTSYW